MSGVQELLASLEAAAERRLYHARDFFEPYPKQVEFCDMGQFKRERCLFAGNQCGKTEIGAYEVMCHLTGDYPAWWMGKRYDRPTKGWVAGVTGLSTRDIVQKKLCGEPGVDSKFGTGMIPRSAFVDKPTLARGVSDLYDKIIVCHTPTGGDSVLMLKSYEQGRQKWQGDTLDFVWYDEEPPEDIYSEGTARLTEGGMEFLTFTPLEGMTNVVTAFLEATTPDKGLVYMTLDDVGHFSPEEKTKRVAGYLPHEREAREKGVPMLGSGRIFQVTEASIRWSPPDHIPDHWVLLWGLDFGIDHPFAAVLLAWDRDSDTIYVLHTIRMSDATYAQHARAMKPFGLIRAAWPQDGHQRDRGNLKPYAQMYREEGIRMLDTHAMFVDGSNSTEAGIAEMDERMKSNRFKVAEHLEDWFKEFRAYHRKDGLIVKLNDDLMSATRVGVMAKRFASFRLKDKGKHRTETARDVDFDLG